MAAPAHVRRPRDRRVPAPGDHDRVAAALLALADDPRVDRVAVSELLATMGDRAPAALVLLFALPNVLPMPPGTSAVLGAPLLFLTVQLALGSKPWLPRAIARRSFARAHLAAAMRRVASWLLDSDRTRPRLAWLAAPLSVRLVGALCSVLALVVLLPIPFGNMPPALAISLCAYGILRCDGRWILAGVATGAASLALGWRVVYALADVGFDWLLRAATKLSGG